MRIRILLLLAMIPLGALAQGVAYVSSPSIPGQQLPYSQYGVTLGTYSPDVQGYAIDINGDGIVDYTLSVHNSIFDIVPAGNNSVLSVPLDGYGAAGVTPLGAGVVIGGSLTPVPAGTFWGNSGNVVGNPNLNYFIDYTTIGIFSPQWGTFALTPGFVGLEFWINNQAYYGFLQLDTRWNFGAGGLYQGYGWNTTPGASITTTYFRDLIQVPEPSTLALLALFGVAAGLVRRRHFLK